jgi:hypothetical protein
MPILHSGQAPTLDAHSPQQAMWPHGANATVRAPAMQIAQATLFCRSVAAASARLSRRAAMRMRLARVVACAQPRWRWVEAVAVRQGAWRMAGRLRGRAEQQKGGARGGQRTEAGRWRVEGGGGEALRRVLCTSSCEIPARESDSRASPSPDAHASCRRASSASSLRARDSPRASVASCARAGRAWGGVCGWGRGGGGRCGACGCEGRARCARRSAR